MLKRIMVVDDDILLLKVINACLTKRGHKVYTFNKGIDAVKFLFEEKPDSVILDVKLPDCDGWFIARILEEVCTKENIQLIMISVLDEDHAKISEIKPYAYIQKPFDIGKLLDAVEKSLKHEQEFIAV